MTIQEFAGRNKVRFSQEECGEIIIRGRKVKHCDSHYPRPSYPSELGLGHIYQHTPERSLFGIVVQPRQPFVWVHVRKRLLAAGFQLLQDGDWEGTLLFDPCNKKQAKLALGVIGVRKKRAISQATASRLAEQLRSARQALNKTPIRDSRIVREAADGAIPQSGEAVLSV